MEIKSEVFELLDYFEEICQTPRNQKLFEAIRDGSQAGMRRDVMEKAIRITKEKGNGAAAYAAAVIRNWNALGIRQLEETPGYRKQKETIAQRLHIDQEEPTGELADWEKNWLREIGYGIK